MRFRDFHPNVKIRITMHFVTGILSGMVLPFMAVYFAKTLGTTTAGLAVMGNIIAGVAATFIGGYYADRIGRKKLMLISELVCTAAYAVMAAANSPWYESPYLTLAMSLVIGAAWGLSKPAADAMLIDVTEPAARKFMYRITYWLNNLSISIAGIIGAFLFSSYLFELLLGVSIVTFISYLVTLIWLSETLQPAAGHVEQGGVAKTGGPFHILKSYGEVFRDRTFMVYVLASLLMVSVEFNLTEYIGIRLERDIHGAVLLPGMAGLNGLELLGILRTENTFAIVVLSLFTGYLLKKYGGTRTMFVGLFLNIAGYSYLAMGNHPWALLVLMLIATIGELIYVPIKQAFLVNIVPDHARSSYMAVNGMLYSGAHFICAINVVIGGFLPAWGMALVLFATGLTGMLLLGSILPKLAPAPNTAAQSNVASAL
ncbi:MFS transporter [Paenibacillus chitinolyticus]|uniref:MFS transporter n=1 Tax=Paenibacillus chitinolyticus TaxID=79263 RepID=UPI0026E4A09D|nr:MFS transporter [Paenibacillus chitinolyticus]GKS11362.1 MFS transporter [Paenibacillus chitinolyticus]